jgi:hypothetical protein
MTFEIGETIVIELEGRTWFGRKTKQYLIGNILLQNRNKAMINTSMGVFWFNKKLLHKVNTCGELYYTKEKDRKNVKTQIRCSLLKPCNKCKEKLL